MMNKKMAILTWFFVIVSALSAYPTPEILVRSKLANKVLSIEIEVDLRCLAENPIKSGYFLNEQLQRWPEKIKSIIAEKAMRFVRERVSLNFYPEGGYEANYRYSFAKIGSGLLENPDDKVAVILKTEVDIDEKRESYFVKSTEKNEFSVEVRNRKDEESEVREITLFPNEMSKPWPLKIDLRK